MTDRNVLPDNLRPVHYDLNVYDIDILSYTFAGTVVITYQVIEPTDVIHLNYRGDLRVKSIGDKYLVKATTDQAEHYAESVNYDNDNEVMSIQLSGPIVGDTVKVVIDYTAKIQDNMAGFYRSLYKDPNGNDAVQLSTQFESTDARATFPCADEPNLKAQFDVKLIIPSEWTALSNMPEKKSESAGNGLKTVTFETTPLMSTYLLAWACGNFEYIERYTDKVYKNGKKIPVRVYTTEGLSWQADLALESACKVLDYFSTIFDLGYVLPKLDLLAAHEFSHNAMENWGLVTYRTTAVLFDSKTSNNIYRSKIVYVVAHELAHMWFGDLVTMDWWDELWLNEGFATWAGWYAVDHLYPEWDVFSRFVSDSMQLGLSLDSLRGSHPIEVPVRSGFDIDQIFDDISYLKGASTIRMLSSQLGEETFILGVSRYLKTHAYGNATTSDLWEALHYVSGVDVKLFMENWIRKIGFPVLTVKEEQDAIKVKQDRFLSSGSIKPEENETLWWIPLAVSSGSSPNDLTIESFDSKVTSLSKSLIVDGFYKLNKNQVGFYRVNYDSDKLLKFGSKSIQSKLTIRDRIGLVADATATAAAGLSSTTGVLVFLEELAKSERDYYVWLEILKAVDVISIAWGCNSSVAKGLTQFKADLIQSCLQDNFPSWELVDSDNDVSLLYQAIMFSAAGSAGVEWIVKESKDRFNRWIESNKTDNSIISPGLKQTVFNTVLQHSKGDELDRFFNAIVDELTNPSTIDAKELAVNAFGSLKDEKYILKVYEIFGQDKIAVQDAHFLLDGMAANAVSRQMNWQYIKTSWDKLHARFSDNTAVFERLVRFALRRYSSLEDYREIEQFFRNKDTKGIDRAVNQVLDLVKLSYQWVDRDTTELETWLSDSRH